MKSKVAARRTCRARSARNMAEPFNTPTRITGWPAKSRVISAPNSATRFDISSREISTFSSVMAFHIKLPSGAFTYESQRCSTYVAGPRYVSHLHPRLHKRDYRSLDHE